MDNDPCSTRTFWSAITAAQLDSTVAGVLAGLLIAAAAALLVQWYQGSDAHTIALFGSGVPALALSTYLFTVIAGARYPEFYPDPANHPDPKIDYKTVGAFGDTLCSQMWSEWVLAIASLFIGSAVLVCGLGLALVSYADNLAVKLCEAKTPVQTVEERRNFFIRLNAWLSGAVITAATALLVSANTVYLTAIGRPRLHYDIFGHPLYLLFVVYLIGLLIFGRSVYVIFKRTRGALRSNKNSIAAYAASLRPVATNGGGINGQVFPGRPPVAKDTTLARRTQVTMRAAKELAIAILVGLAALLAGYMTSGQAFNQSRGMVVSTNIVIYVVVLYILVRAAYVLIARGIGRASAKDVHTPTNNEAVPAVNAKLEERIRIKYSVGGLSTTTYSVVFLAILGTLFVVGLTQGQLWTGPRIAISLFLGGLFPAAILAGLSHSLPSAEEAGSSEERHAGSLEERDAGSLEERDAGSLEERDAGSLEERKDSTLAQTRTLLAARRR
jgi:hypothetical protein